MTVGDTSNWDGFFRMNMVPAVLAYIKTVWDEMPKPGLSDLEDAISDKLYFALVHAKPRNDFPFLIRREDVEFHEDLAMETGRKDIVFFPSLLEEEIYLCIEAKRLNAIISGKLRSLANEYVKEGMQRFVDRKYARCVLHGAMLAYVLDGNIDRAIKNIGKNIKNRLSELRMDTDCCLDASLIRPDDCRVKETRHHRVDEKAVFCIHHIFVA